MSVSREIFVASSKRYFLASALITDGIPLNLNRGSGRVAKSNSLFFGNFSNRFNIESLKTDPTEKAIGYDFPKSGSSLETNFCSAEVT